MRRESSYNKNHLCPNAGGSCIIQINFNTWKNHLGPIVSGGYITLIKLSHLEEPLGSDCQWELHISNQLSHMEEPLGSDCQWGLHNSNQTFTPGRTTWVRLLVGAAHIKSTFTHGRTTWVRLLVGVAHIKASSHTWKNNVGPIVSGHCTIDTIARPSRQKSQNTLNFILCNKYIQHNENNHFTYCKYFRIDLKIMTSRIYTITLFDKHIKSKGRYRTAQTDAQFMSKVLH